MNDTLKLVLVGQLGAGKTSLLQSHSKKEFRAHNESTVAVDFSGVKNVLVNGKLFDISIWDTAGQEKFRSITKMSFQNTNVAILCFDLSDPNSYIHIQGWIDFLQANCTSELAIIIVGTKMDLPTFYNKEDLEKFLQTLNTQQQLKLFLTSAKTREGIDETFQYAFEQGAKIKMKTNNQLEKSSIILVPEIQSKTRQVDKQSFNDSYCYYCS